MYVVLKMSDSECASLPSRSQCDDYNNFPGSTPGIDMRNPEKLQHVVVTLSPKPFRYAGPYRVVGSAMQRVRSLA